MSDSAEPLKTFVIPDVIANELEKLDQRVELVTSDGKRLGEFEPAPICPWDPSLTRERVEQMVKEGGRPLSEIWKRLGVM